MQFATVARIFRHPDDAISLHDVWTIVDGELNKVSEVASKHLRDTSGLAELHREVAWSAQALVEFMDLDNFMRPALGQWQHRNYLYLEAISALREATVGIFNGTPRASIGLLRSVLEMLLLHCWWQEHICRKGKSDHFYEWLEGKRHKPNFKDVVKDNFKFLDIPADTHAMEHVNRTYERLCSYVHAPIRKESVTILNRGNALGCSIEVLLHWLTLARDSLRIALEHLIHLHPQCLFPVDITRKFGFNPPVGMYFDRFNFVPLEAVLGEDQIKNYRARVSDHHIVSGAMEFYDSQPDLTHEQILATWNDMDDPEAPNEAKGDVEALWFRVKATMRVLSMGLAYAKPLTPRL